MQNTDVNNYSESPIISIITICYNAEKFISRTMHSVLNQSYKNIEYIIIDGASNDNTLDIIKAIKNNYSNRYIKIISEPDQGIADAMNKGIILASGKIITHLHAGDKYIDESVVHKVIESYIEHKWQWGIAGSIVVDEQGYSKHLYSGNADYRILLRKNFIPHQSTFLVKDIFEKHGLFDVSYKQAMDYEFWIRITFLKGERYMILPFNTTYFLDGGTSSRIFELLKYSYKIRKSMFKYGCKVNFIDDCLFLTRVFIFYIFYRLKQITLSL